jgi:hypothetical protein
MMQPRPHGTAMQLRSGFWLTSNEPTYRGKSAGHKNLPQYQFTRDAWACGNIRVLRHHDRGRGACVLFHKETAEQCRQRIAGFVDSSFMARARTSSTAI